MIIEMAGRPATHLTESLEKHVNILRDVRDLSVHEIRVSEPKVIPSENKNQESEPAPEMFTAFAECDFEVPSFARLSDTVFDFMPSSVEVIEPGKVSLEAAEVTNLLNNIAGRMHRYDEIAKVAEERLRQQQEQLQLMQKAIIVRDLKIVELSSKQTKKKKKTKKKG